jgi:hypothetical protein
LVHSERAKRFFGTSKTGQKVFRTQKNFFLNRNRMKVHQKAEERRAFENLLAHFGCPENHSFIPKRMGCCK